MLSDPVEIFERRAIPDLAVAGDLDRVLHPNAGVGLRPDFPPDGHRIAYTSSESGVAQVYVQPYPSLDSKHPVSVNGGQSPVWSRDGHTLHFIERDNGQATRLFSVKVKRSTFFAGVPRPVLDLPSSYLFGSGGVTPNYDVALDGTRFLGIQLRPTPQQPAPTAIQLTLNAFEELRARAPKR